MGYINRFRNGFSQLFYILTLITKFTNISSITFKIDGYKTKSFCIYKQIYLEEEITLSFVISSGYHGDKCHVLFFDPDNKLVNSHYSSIQGEMPNYKASKEGKYKLCISPLSKAKIMATVELHTLNELGLSKDLAKDGNQIKIFIPLK